MPRKMPFPIGLWILLLLKCSTISTQNIHSIRGSNPDACNVVNVHFGDGNGEVGSPTDIKFGPPGKRGAAGPTGPKGFKGEKGDKGTRCQPIDVAALKTDVAATFGARSCSDLRDNHGIVKTGYYWMRGNNLSSNKGVFKYCDFHIYQDVSNCAELTNKHNISIYGYYLFGNATEGFHYCPDVYTCHHLVQRDSITESGFYQVGSPDDQYTVYCSLFSGNRDCIGPINQSMTNVVPAIVWPIIFNNMISGNNLKKADDCESNGCYSHRPQYFATMDQIEKTINNSNRCQQFIEFECLGVVLLYHPNAPRGYWVSRDGERMQYWGGASSKRSGYCACGETGTCVLKTKRCNCDINTSPITRDNGYLTDKSKLPVSELRFGDMGDASEKGWHTLGKLECIGEE